MRSLERSLPLLPLAFALAVPGLAQTDNLEFVGHNEDNPFHMMYAEIVGTRLFVSEGLGANGVETYDISDPYNPIRVGPAALLTGRFDSPPAPAPTWRTRAYPKTDRLYGFAHREGVQIYDITGPASLIREYDPPDFTEYEGGVLRDSILYVAAHQVGIEMLHVSDPGPITLLGGIDLGENAAWDAELVGDHLVIANGRFGLAVVDISVDPPVMVTTLPLPGLANDILVDGVVAFVSLGPAGLASIDVTDPTAPFILDLNQETTGNATEIDLLDGRLVAGSWMRLETYDVTDPADLHLVGWDDTKTWAMGAAMNDDPGSPLIGVADWRGISVYRPAPDTAPDIEMEPHQIDFGSVTAARDTTARINNRGSSTLHVSSTVVPGGFSIFPSSFDIPPGGTQEVTITASGTGSAANSIRYLSDDPDEASLRQYVFKNNGGEFGFPQIGDPAPDFVLFGTDGVMHTLSEEFGRVVFLEFGANW